MDKLLLLPMLVHILLVALLYVLLTVMRAPKVWGIAANTDGSNPFASMELRVSANLSNQFEWPVLFYAACIIVVCRPELYQSSQLYCAWLFIFGRIAHSIIQIFTTNIRLRGTIFSINFIAVILMWITLGANIFSQ
ncbi:MAPEG family protein [Gilvimarinus polysaccharolyticus]|uniref:MAPEG family protein n=1 Tax=Gilvimarinus polysaccharolyticus TaxID=863921 RepID=UPI000673BFF6